MGLSVMSIVYYISKAITLVAGGFGTGFVERVEVRTSGFGVSAKKQFTCRSSWATRRRECWEELHQKQW